MRKTYVTRVPDQHGIFLKVSRIIDDCGGRMVRVNYNRAVDAHTLFLEIDAEPEHHERISQVFLENGYMHSTANQPRILMLSLKILGETGKLTKALEVMSHYPINISYISSQVEGESHVQNLKLGILIENTVEISGMLEEVSQICETSILNYEVTDRLLDATVFYVSFTNEMRDILHLSDHDANCVLIRSNKLMQVLDEQKKSPLQTFDYIRRFAKFVQDHKGKDFDVKVSSRKLAEDLTLTTLEPPCGSNTFVLEHGEEMLFVDGGYGCFLKEMEDLLEKQFPDFRTRKKEAIITHIDMDHTGLVPLFGTVYMSRNSLEDLKMEEKGCKGFREQNPRHNPYFGISELITGYVPPKTDTFVAVGEREGEELLCPIGSIHFGGRKLDFYEGLGGHVKGEVVVVCEELKFLFSGDIFVNVKGISAEQKEFNRLAPFLLTGVDEDPALSRKEREELLAKFHGYLYCPGHGPVLDMP